jgi:hypothetical protein
MLVLTQASVAILLKEIRPHKDPFDSRIYMWLAVLRTLILIFASAFAYPNSASDGMGIFVFILHIIIYVLLTCVTMRKVIMKTKGLCGKKKPTNATVSGQQYILCLVIISDCALWMDS